MANDAGNLFKWGVVAVLGFYGLKTVNSLFGSNSSPYSSYPSGLNDFFGSGSNSQPTPLQQLLKANSAEPQPLVKNGVMSLNEQNVKYFGDYGVNIQTEAEKQAVFSKLWNSTYKQQLYTGSIGIIKETPASILETQAKYGLIGGNIAPNDERITERANALPTVSSGTSKKSAGSNSVVAKASNLVVVPISSNKLTASQISGYNKLVPKVSSFSYGGVGFN